ncbi:hypothetical protein [Telmatospirillum sp.]|uniref:hypothetical protein n=1 Tax=Telmatospirillum sp. TaxID=2079197 RepID=UPI00284AD357|nr:hypothetical protein [Telmatospirillum sp.]MDR3435050.1 hypothetical protein [Telmatospirillum sp.]
MEKSLDEKLATLAENPAANCFILADAKDPDMARGIASAGKNADGTRRSVTDLRDQIREIVNQGLVDIMLMSASTSEVLALEEKIFDTSPVTPAVRANDTTDIHIVRGGCYPTAPARPFMSTTIDHIQAGKTACSPAERLRGPNLGLYSVTFNNIPERDLETLEAYKAFRIEAESKGFRHFLEVFAPNVPAELHHLSPEVIPAFMNDHIVRMLAGLPKSSRPCFLKLPYLGPRAIEELCTYDPTIIVGVLGGSAGTTHDAFHLLEDAKKHGARVALFGRKIIAAEHQLSFVAHLRQVADGALTALDAVRSYHGDLAKLNIRPHRSLQDDLTLTSTQFAY